MILYKYITEIILKGTVGKTHVELKMFSFLEQNCQNSLITLVSDMQLKRKKKTLLKIHINYMNKRKVRVT